MTDKLNMRKPLFSFLLTIRRILSYLHLSFSHLLIHIQNLPFGLTSLIDRLWICKSINYTHAKIKRDLLSQTVISTSPKFINFFSNVYIT